MCRRINSICFNLSKKILLLTLCFVLLSTTIYAQSPTKSEIQDKSLFDIFVSIPQDYQSIHPGDELLTSIKLVNLGSAGRIDVLLHFIIKDSSGVTIMEKQETVAVETQSSFVRTFDISEDASTGKYLFFAKIIYADGKEASAQTDFSVIASPNSTQSKDYLNFGIIVLAAILIILILIYLFPKWEKFIEYARMRYNIHKIVTKKLSS